MENEIPTDEAFVDHDLVREMAGGNLETNLNLPQESRLKRAAKTAACAILSSIAGGATATTASVIQRTGQIGSPSDYDIPYSLAGAVAGLVIYALYKAARTQMQENS